MSDRWNEERERWRRESQARRGQGDDLYPDDPAAIYQERSFLPPGQADFSRYGEGGYDDRRGYQSQGGFSPAQPHGQGWQGQRYTQGDYAQRFETERYRQPQQRGRGAWGPSGPPHDRVFGERETGTDYTQDPRGFGPRGYGPRDQAYGQGGYQRQQGGEGYDYRRASYGTSFGEGGYGESYGQGWQGQRYQRAFERDAQYGRHTREDDDRGAWGQHRVEQGPYANTGHSNDPLSHYPPSSYEPGRYGEPYGGRYGGYGEGAGQTYAGGAAYGQSHRGRGPKGYQRADERIREDANDRLTDDPFIDATDIDVSVAGGELTLAGVVDSREAKRRAERLVEDVVGVTHVQNNLRVKSAFAESYPNTGAATHSVLAAQTDGHPGDTDEPHRQVNLTSGVPATGSAAAADAQSAEGRSTAQNSPDKGLNPAATIDPKLPH